MLYKFPASTRNYRLRGMDQCPEFNYGVLKQNKSEDDTSALGLQDLLNPMGCLNSPRMSSQVGQTSGCDHDGV